MDSETQMLLQPCPSTWVAPDELLKPTTHRPKGRAVSWLQCSSLFQQRMEIHNQQDWSRKLSLSTVLVLPSCWRQLHLLCLKTLTGNSHAKTAQLAQYNHLHKVSSDWDSTESVIGMNAGKTISGPSVPTPVLFFFLAFFITLTHSYEQIQLPS